VTASLSRNQASLLEAAQPLSRYSGRVFTNHHHPRRVITSTATKTTRRSTICQNLPVSVPALIANAKGIVKGMTGTSAASRLASILLAVGETAYVYGYGPRPLEGLLAQTPGRRAVGPEIHPRRSLLPALPLNRARWRPYPLRRGRGMGVMWETLRVTLDGHHLATRRAQPVLRGGDPRSGRSLCA
jgi:hypothetical protein